MFSDENTAQGILICRLGDVRCPFIRGLFWLRTSQPALYEQPEHAIPGEPWCPALPDFGRCENEILEIDNGRFYGYNKAILVAE